MATLNAQQEKAVHHFGSPLLIIAGAGSGKTTVLMHKIKFLTEEMGFPPESILAITFTNKAAKEMQERVQKMLPSQSGFPVMSTFHAFAADLLRHHFHHLNRQRDFTILDKQDEKRLVAGLLQKKNVNEDRYPPASLMHQFDRFQTQLLFPKKVVEAPFQHHTDPTTAELYKDFFVQLEKENAITFSGLLFWAYQVLAIPEVLDYYHRRFLYIMVDEYQDTNWVQYQLVSLLSKPFGNITVVGDFDQNIYSFRGASLQNILNFEKDFANSTTILLEQNYRSTTTILNAANHLIAHNTQRKDKKLWSQNEAGEKIQLAQCPDERKEAQILVEHLRSAPKDWVILYRINALSRVIEETLSRAGIPYRIVGGLKFFDRKEIKDLLAYLRLIHNPKDRLAFQRIVNFPKREIGTTTVSKLMGFSDREDSDVESAFKSNQAAFPTRAQTSLTGFFDLMSELRQAASRHTVRALIELILEKTSYIRSYGQDNPSETESRIENIYELLSVAEEGNPDLESFLNKIALITDLDTADTVNAECVTLMTIHNAKGLEFDCVAIAGLEEGVLPHYKSLNTDSEMEEERRLLYVAMTRARKKLILTSSSSRTLFGETHTQAPSRFIEELPKSLLEEKQSEGYAPKPIFNQNRTQVVKKDTDQYQVGMQVSHAVWGKGVIIKSQGESQDKTLVINFSGSTKTLMAKYAPLTIL